MRFLPAIPIRFPRRRRDAAAQPPEADDQLPLETAQEGGDDADSSADAETIAPEAVLEALPSPEEETREEQAEEADAPADGEPSEEPAKPRRRRFPRLRLRRRRAPAPETVAAVSLEPVQPPAEGEEPAEEAPAEDEPFPRRKQQRPLRRMVQTVKDLVRPKKLTLCVENGTVRIVVFQGSKAIAWGTAVPDEDVQASELDLGALDEGYAFRLYSLLAELEYQRLRLVTEVPLYAPLIRHFEMPRLRKRYYEEVVFSEVLSNIPFGQDEVDIFWQRRKNGGDQEVYAVAVPRSVVDRHVQGLKEAQLQPLAGYSLATALAHSVDMADVIVVHLVPVYAAIVLVRDNLPKVVHRVEIRNDTPVEQQADAIAKAVEQVAGYELTNSGALEGQPLPVVLTGQLSAESPLAEAFQRSCQRAILPFQPKVTYPEHFTPSEYAVNIGMALADKARRRSGAGVRMDQVPSLSLLSERHLPRPIPFKPVGTFATLLLFASVALNLTPRVDNVVLEAAALTDRVNSLERQARLRRLDLGKLRDIEEQTDATAAFTGRLSERLKALQADVEHSMARLDAIAAGALPEGVQVSSVVLEGSEFSLAGSADSYESVVQYTSNLRSYGPEMFSSVRIVRASASDQGGEVLFQVKIAIPEDGLTVAGAASLGATSSRASTATTPTRTRVR